MPNQKDIARKLNLSQMTVSRVLNHSPLVKEGTRKLVQEELAKSGYTLNMNARNLISGRRGTVGIITPGTETYKYVYFYQPLAGVSATLRRHNYNLNLVDVDGVAAIGEGLAPLAPQVDGFIVFNLSGLDPYFEELSAALRQIGKPCVLIQPHRRKSIFPFVTVDNFHGGFIATEHLIRLGHRRLAFLGRAAPGGTEGGERLRGFKAACADNHLPLSENRIIAGEEVEPEKMVKALFSGKKPNRPTALFCWSDSLARAVIYELKALGLKVPDHVSVVGFNDLELSTTFMRPRLTSVRQPLHEAGAKAAAILLEGCEHKKIPPGNAVLKPSLIVRDSCARKVAEPDLR